MTEEEWLTCADPNPMLDHLEAGARDRKLRLFACACCRRVTPLFQDRSNLRAVEVAEQFAEGRVTAEELSSINHAQWDKLNKETTRALRNEAGLVGAATTTPVRADLAANTPAKMMYLALFGMDHYWHLWVQVRHTDWLKTAALLRDIFGNPFRPVAVNPSWLTPDVVGLAQTIYDNRTFDRMPELADTLEHAGCKNSDVLYHCRQPEPHVRGCWLVDILLGKD